MRYQLSAPTFTFDVEGESRFIAALAALGFEVLAGREQRTCLRAELQGQPKFDGVYGPMWGGEGCIRYETPESYRANSAD